MRQNKFKIINIFITLIIMFISTDVLAVENYMNFISLEGDQDFSQNIVKTILQDSRGYIWFGTNNGLEKYDGYTTKNYRQTPFEINTLLDNYIVDLEEDDLGNIWIGTNKGITKLDPKKDIFTHYTNIEGEAGTINSDKIRTIYKDEKGDIWVGTADSGLSKYDPEKDKFVPCELDLTSEKITIIYEDDEESLWVGTEKGLNKVERVSNRVKKYQKGTTEWSLSGNYITSICKDSFGKLWIGTRNEGIDKLSLKDGTVKKYLKDETDSYSLGSNAITSIIEDKNKTIWIGSKKGGLAKYDRTNDHFIKRATDSKNIQSNRQNNIITLYQDRAGLIWVGIEYGGVNKFNPLASFQNYTTVGAFDNSMNDNNILSIYKDSDNIIWAGTKNGGINKLDMKNKSVKYFTHSANDPNSMSSNTINTIIEDEDKVLWIGTDAGLNSLDKKTEQVKRYPSNEGKESISNNNIQSLFVDSRGDIWIGTEDGLDKIDGVTRKFTHFNIQNSNISSNYITTIFESSMGELWVGTYHDGLNKYDREKKEFKVYKNNPKDRSTISNDQIKDIIEDDYGNMWIGTSNGLNKYDKKTRDFKVFTENNQLKSNFISGILKYEDNIWISSNDGISKFNILDEKITRNYSAIDGLQGNYFNTGSVFMSYDKQLLFGGTEGFNTIYPENEKTISYKPRLLLSEFKVNDKSMDLVNNSKVVLDYNQNRIYFEFSVIDYKKPNNNSHSFKLQGYEENWNNVRNRNYGVYNNLKPGNYKLKIKGANSEGIWAGQWMQIDIVIKPPFWKTNLAYILYVLLLILIVYLILNYVKVLEKIINERTQQLNKTNAKLVDEINQRKKTEEMLKQTIDENKKLFEEKMEIENFRNDFFINLSHELKTPLNIIMSTLQLSEITLRNNSLESIVIKLLGHIRSIQKNCFKLLKIINDIIDVSKLESKQYELNMQLLNLVYLTEDVVNSTLDYARDKGIDITFDTETEEEIVKCDAVEMERVLLNLISNAIKYNNRGGYIFVNMVRNAEYVDIYIIDNGIGIPKEKQNTIFEKFKRVDEAKKTGSGIGLSLSKLLVDMQGGKLDFESTEGVGSEFIVSIPVYDIREDEYNQVLDLEALDKENMDLEIEMSEIQ